MSVRLPVPIRKVIKFIVDRLMKHRLRDVKPFRPWISGGWASDGSGGVAAFKILDEGHRRRVIDAIGTEDLLQALAGTAITSGKEKRQALWMGEVFDKISNNALPLEVCALITPRVGGWWSNFHPSTLTDKKQVKWFSEKIDLAILPCVILDDKGRVNHSGASSMIVEIIAATLLIDLRSHEATGKMGDFGAAMAGDGDNKGTSFVVAKLYTGSEPAASVVRLLADICTTRDVLPQVNWVPRDRNTWADDLSKLLVEDFDIEQRHNIEWGKYRAIQEDHEAFSLTPRAPAPIMISLDMQVHGKHATEGRNRGEKKTKKGHIGRERQTIRWNVLAGPSSLESGTRLARGLGWLRL